MLQTGEQLQRTTPIVEPLELIIPIAEKLKRIILIVKHLKQTIPIVYLGEFEPDGRSFIGAHKLCCPRRFQDGIRPQRGYAVLGVAALLTAD